MMSSRLPPTFIPTTPSSQPFMTLPSPRGKENACPRFHEASNSVLFVQEYPSYWTLTVSPVAAAAPVPTMRSQASSCDGGAPEGTVTVGRVPKVPDGERSPGGIGAIPATAAPAELACDVAGCVGPVVVADEASVVELGKLEELDELDEHAAVANIRAVPIARRLKELFKVKEKCLGMAARLVPLIARLSEQDCSVLSIPIG
jgi:hypothetical protein